MREQLKSRAEDAVSIALEAGASDAWSATSRSRSVEYSVRDGVLEEVQDKTEQRLSIELYVEGRYSSHSTSDLRPDRLKAFIAEGVALTRALEADEHRKITEPALFADRPAVDLEAMDNSVVNVDGEHRLSTCQSMQEVIKGKDKVISSTSGISDAHNLNVSISSNGFEGVWESTSYWYGTSVTVQGEGDKRPEDWLWVGGRHKDGLLDPQKVATGALDGARGRLGSTKGPTKKTLMVIHPRVTRRLVSQLLRSNNARGIQQKRSLFADTLGKKMFSDKLTMIDDPLIKRGLSSRLYDSEGISSKVLPIVEAGVVRNHYVDTYYGRKLGIAPTTGSRSNLVVAPGERDLDAIVADAGDAILVTSWLGGNADATTGDYSLGLRGNLVTAGKIGAPVGEMNVSGNLIDLFSSLVEVGNDPWPWSSMRVPTLVFEGVQFSGA